MDKEIVSNSPASCGYCCEDDSDHVFFNNMKEEQRCEWIPTPLMRTKYCPSLQNGHMIRDECPKACDFCQSKVVYPTMDIPSASASPTSPITCTKVLTSASTLCRNNEKFEYENISNQSCRWIESVESRRQTMCGYDHVVSNYQISCGHCCEDDANYYFHNERNSNETKTCDWITHSTMEQKKYCALLRNGRMVYDACEQSCNSCKSKVIEKERNFIVTPTETPTLDPSIAHYQQCISEEKRKWNYLMNSIMKYLLAN